MDSGHQMLTVFGSYPFDVLYVEDSVRSIPGPKGPGQVPWVPFGTSKALIPFACSDEFRPQLGMDGALGGGTDFRMELAMEGCMNIRYQYDRYRYQHQFWIQES